jgi:hypothetical protein
LVSGVEQLNRQGSASCLVAAALAALVAVPGGVSSDSTKVYRCVSAQGATEYRQRPCVSGTQEELEIEDAKVGWDAPAVTVESRPAKKVSKTRRSSRSARDRQKERCFKTEQRLESLNRRLRKGYRAGRGADLRHRRRQYEAYLDEFC